MIRGLDEDATSEDWLSLEGAQPAAFAIEEILDAPQGRSRGLGSSQASLGAEQREVPEEVVGVR